MKNFLKENKLSIIMTLIILILGSIAYFGVSDRKEMPNSKVIDPKIYESMKIKTDYTQEGGIKIFANSEELKNTDIKAEEGKKIAESNKIIIGYDEANMMKEEKLFSNINDEIKNLFGADILIGGILEKTNSPIDDMHFLSNETFDRIEGDEDKLFIKMKDNTPKLFLNYEKQDKEKIAVSLIEGNIEEYNVLKIGDRVYYPLIIGYKEAKMMKEEKLFSKPGDTITNLFGKDFIVIGIAKETNTSLDMMHMTPLQKSEL